MKLFINKSRFAEMHLFDFSLKMYGLVALRHIGYMLYKEAITWNKIVGILVCLAGLGLINLK